MGLPKITFNIADDGLNRINGDVEKTPGLLITGVTVAGNVTIGTSYQIFNLNQAVDLGITAGGVNDFAFKQIKAFYKSAGSGTALWFMLVSDATTMEDMADVNNEFAKKLVQDAKGAIRVIGFLRKVTGLETIVNGLDQDAKLAAIKAQELAEYFEEKYMPFRFVVSGNSFSGIAADLENFQESNFNKGSILIGNTDASSEASIGLLLGRIANIPTQRSIARVKDGAVEEIGAFFTNAAAVDGLVDVWDAIHDKGYIFLRSFAGRSGFYFTDDRTLTDVSDDFSALARGFVMDEAVIIAYNTLTEELSDEVPLTNDGKIHPAIIKSWQSSVETQIEGLMVSQGKLNAVEVIIDSDQNVLATDKIIVSIKLQPVGYAKFIEVNIGFTTQINN